MNECAFPLPPVMDAHVHIFTRGMPLAEKAWTRPDYDFTAEQFLAALDQHGIAFGVIAAVTLFGDYNDYTLEALRRHRRLRDPQGERQRLHGPIVCVGRSGFELRRQRRRDPCGALRDQRALRTIQH